MRTFAILLFTALSFAAHASYDRGGAGSCESRLLMEFSQRPDDRDLGKITERVAMTPDNLVVALERGIFPYFINERGNPHWASPPERGVFLFADLHISRSDQEFIDRALADPSFEITFDQDFAGVIQGCADMIRWRRLANGDRIPDGKWISPEYIENYTSLFERGLAHSVEVWHNGILVGGLYGTFIKGVFAGESMFHLEPNVTKLAYHALIKRLMSKGHWFIDTQQSRSNEPPPPNGVPFSRSLADKWGAKAVPREDFRRMLARAQAENLPF